VQFIPFVMAGFIPAIHVGVQSAGLCAFGSTWMPGTSPGMTEGKR